MWKALSVMVNLARWRSARPFRRASASYLLWHLWRSERKSSHVQLDGLWSRCAVVRRPGSPGLTVTGGENAPAYLVMAWPRQNRATGIRGSRTHKPQPARSGKLSPELIGKAVNETEKQVNSLMLAFVGAVAFCVLSLLTPDSGECQRSCRLPFVTIFPILRLVTSVPRCSLRRRSGARHPRHARAR